MSAIKAIALTRRDNLATAIVDIGANTEVSVKIEEKVKKILVKQPIPFGHKFALREIESGSEVIKYGEVIGRATKNIELGEHVHIHNVEGIRGKIEIGGVYHGDFGI